mgnify:FL=1
METNFQTTSQSRLHQLPIIPLIEIAKFANSINFLLTSKAEYYNERYEVLAELIRITPIHRYNYAIDIRQLMRENIQSTANIYREVHLAHKFISLIKPPTHQQPDLIDTRIRQYLQRYKFTPHQNQSTYTYPYTQDLRNNFHPLSIWCGIGCCTTCDKRTFVIRSPNKNIYCRTCYSHTPYNFVSRNIVYIVRDALRKGILSIEDFKNIVKN